MSAGAPSAGMCAASHADDLVDRRDVVGLRAGVALGPAADLALDVARGLAEVAEAGGGVVDRVQIDERVDEQLADAAHARVIGASPRGRSLRRMTPRRRSIR